MATAGRSRRFAHDSFLIALLVLLTTMWIVSAATPVAAAPVSVIGTPDGALGLSTRSLREENDRLALPDALAAFNAGKFTPGKSPVLNFGIGAKPVWIHLAVDNPTAQPQVRRLSLETAWLDHIEVYFRHGGRSVAPYRAGDHLEFARRPVTSRYFMFDQAYAPGISDVFIRVETPDPMVLPIHLASPDTARTREARQEFSYGVIYGFLLALMAYNALLYVSLRSKRYLLYAFYLMAFVALNVAYTGHGYAWLWPGAPTWQAWSNAVLIILYGVSGLLFAIRFLNLRDDFPHIRRIVLGFCGAGVASLAGAILLDSRFAALLISFSFAFLFTGIMLFLGIVSVRAGHKPAQYFLIAAVAAMVGALLTLLSTWGFIPHNDWTFRAVEIGMLLDATLLALALGYQFRVGQEEKLRAEQLAQQDPLTGLNNRRAFYHRTGPLWNNAIRHQHPAAVMLFDVDWFKRINDTLGHAHGDVVLKAMAEVLKQSIRQGDVAARWGGEEFIVFLPETDLSAARVLAERLRISIAGMAVPHGTGETSVTVSIGIAQKEDTHATLDALIAAADQCLYQSKEQGRNRVTSGSLASDERLSRARG